MKSEDRCFFSCERIGIGMFAALVVVFVAVFIGALFTSSIWAGIIGTALLAYVFVMGYLISTEG